MRFLLEFLKSQIVLRSCDALSFEVELEFLFTLRVLFLKEFLFELTNMLIHIFQQNSYRVLVLGQVVNEDILVSFILRGSRLVITFFFGLFDISCLTFLLLLWP